MSEILHDVSVIIGYRQASADRKLGLQFVLNWLYKHLPEVEILLIEQDEFQKIDVVLPPTCRYFFTYNPGLYNRCWAFNVGINLTDRNILAFSDSDMFMSREDYIRAFEACRTFQAVNPNGERVFNIINADPDALTYEISEKRKLWTMAAGLLIMQREAVEIISGWDERFEGWGAEDNAISHMIYQKLTSKTLDCLMYHVDHARSIFDGNTQPGYLYNQMLYEEIVTLYGDSLDRFLENRKKLPRGNPDLYKLKREMTEEETLHFVLAVTTFNRVKYVREFLDSWDQTRSKDAKWTIIVADDGSTDETLEYLDGLHFDGIDLIINKNKRLGIAGQTNTIIEKLSELDFDVCFCCNDDILFTKEGWEQLYWSVIKRTGYEHLCYFDTRWREAHNLPNPKKYGQLINNCLPENVQGCFFTLTPEVIRTVGYFDIVHFGFRGLAHVDYTWRCCRAGFNSPDMPFDVLKSIEYIKTQKENYIYSIPGPIQSTINSENEKVRKWNLIRKNRIFIPKSDINVMPEILELHENGEDVSHLISTQKKTTPAPPVTSPKPPQSNSAEIKNTVKPIENQIVSDKKDDLNKHADASIKNGTNSENSINNITDESKNSKFVYLNPDEIPVIPPDKMEDTVNKAVYRYANDKGSFTKKAYNFLIHNRIHFIIKAMDNIANKLIKAGYNIKNIDRK